MTYQKRYLPLLLGLLLVYWTVSLHELTVVPTVYEDEPWQASTGWKLAREAIFGSDMFAGYYGMEHHYYGYLPVHPLLLAVIFRVAGLGLFQARFEPVVMGLFGLALTYALGRRLFQPAVGLLAVYLLLFVRLTGLTPSQYTGIIWLDFARIARYDMVVPLFGLSALLVYWSAARSTSSRAIWRYGLAGCLAALAGLSHLYGLFWMVVLVSLVVVQRSGWRPAIALLLGFVLPWLPYLAYVLGGLPDWVGQTRDYAPRFELLNPRWYGRNVLREVQRYGPGLGPPGWHYLLRPGLWTAVVGLPLAFLALARRAWAGNRAATTLLVPAVLLPILFALFIYLKLANYLVTVAPLLALVGGWGLHELWSRRFRQSPGTGVHEVADPGTWRAPGKGGQMMRLLLITLLLAITLEGIGRIRALQVAARETTPYADFIAQVRAHVPAGTRILGLHHYWLGLDERDYRTWAVPLLQRDARYWSPPLPIETALDNIMPEVILLDRRMQMFFDDDPVTARAIRNWMAARGYYLAAAVDDRSYGRMEIYRRPR